MADEKLSFEEVNQEIKKLQKMVNEEIETILNKSAIPIGINILPTYLSHVKTENGYPIQLNVIKIDNYNKMPNQRVYGNILNFSKVD